MEASGSRQQRRDAIEDALASGDTSLALMLLEDLDDEEGLLAADHHVRAEVLAAHKEYHGAMEACRRGLRSLHSGREPYSEELETALTLTRIEVLAAKGEHDEALMETEFLLENHPEKRSELAEVHAEALLEASRPQEAVVALVEGADTDRDRLLSAAALVGSDKEAAELVREWENLPRGADEDPVWQAGALSHLEHHALAVAVLEDAHGRGVHHRKDEAGRLALRARQVVRSPVTYPFVLLSALMLVVSWLLSVVPGPDGENLAGITRTGAVSGIVLSAVVGITQLTNRSRADRNALRRALAEPEVALALASTGTILATLLVLAQHPTLATLPLVRWGWVLPLVVTLGVTSVRRRRGQGATPLDRAALTPPSVQALLSDDTLGLRVASNCRLGPFRIGHGDLWLTRDGILRHARGAKGTLLSLLQVDTPDGEVERLGAGGAALAAQKHPRDLYVPLESVLRASGRAGRVKLELKDGRVVSLHWRGDADGRDQVQSYLSATLPGRYSRTTR